MLSRRPEAVAEVSVGLWLQLSKSLVAIIGQEGFEALYDRSLHLASEAHRWLVDEVPHASESTRFERLHSALQSKDLAEATSATVLLLSTFTGILSTLIGQQLTTNILRAAWGDAFEEAAQGIPQCPTK